MWTATGEMVEMILIGWQFVVVFCKRYEALPHYFMDHIMPVSSLVRQAWC
jgi:hypothetical protein